jgi:hypothetical protein
VAIREKVLGPRSPDLAQALENYASLLRRMNQEEKAVTFEERVRTIRVRLIS